MTEALRFQQGMFNTQHDLMAKRIVKLREGLQAFRKFFIGVDPETASVEEVKAMREAGLNLMQQYSFDLDKFDEWLSEFSKDWNCKVDDVIGEGG